MEEKLDLLKVTMEYNGQTFYVFKALKDIVDPETGEVLMKKGECCASLKTDFDDC